MNIPKTLGFIYLWRIIETLQSVVISINGKAKSCNIRFVVMPN